MKKLTLTDTSKTTNFKVTPEEANLWKLGAAPPDTIPPGYRSKWEWAKIWNKGECYTRKLLKRLVAAGHLEKKQFRTRIRTGTRPLWYYRMKR